MHPYHVLALLLIVAIVTAGAVIKMLASGVTDRQPAEDARAAFRAAELMAQENERLKGQMGRLEERIAVLERIATDPAERIARDIERLR